MGCRRRTAVSAFACALALAPAIVRAEPTEQDKALATTLFNDGKTLLADGKISEACRKLEESRRLDPQPGTVLNVAACHEREGLTASAWAEFREARVLAVRDGRDDRVAFADEHMKALEPRLSSIVITVAPEVDAPELHVSRDGTLLGRAAWGTRIPVDPGEHLVEAGAPGKKAWRTSVVVQGEAQVATVAVGPLEDEPPVVVQAAPPSPRMEIEQPPSGLSSRRTIALGAAGLGVVAVGLGTFFGVRAIVKHHDPDAACATDPCSSQSVSLNDQAKFAADASTVSFVVAIAALATGAFLWFGDTSRARTPSVTVAPTWSPNAAGLGARGRF